MARVLCNGHLAASVGETLRGDSLCWAALMRPKVPYLNALRQIESILLLAASTLVFRDRLSLRQGKRALILTVSRRSPFPVG